MAASKQELESWFEENLSALVQATFSKAVAEDNKVQKVVLRQVLIQEKLHIQMTCFEKTKCSTKNIAVSGFVKEFSTLLEHFEHLFVRTNSFEYYVEKTVQGTWKTKKRKLQEECCADFAHNRKKNYLIEEGLGRPVACLEALGIMTSDGKVKKEARAKFKQIQHFSQLVFDLLPHFEKEKEKGKTLRIVDLGCGKAYLSFALYHLLSTKTEYKVELIGVDLKSDVVDFCNALAKKVGYDGLSFVFGTISEYQPAGVVDIVIALHACDTATDQAIFQAVKWQAEALFVAPCCQHELAQQLKATAFPLITKYGLFREQFAALLTDAIRAELLSTLGYKIDVCEFVDPVHTPKNTLIRALKINKGKEQQNVFVGQEYKKVKSEFGLQPALEKLLFPFCE